MSDTSTIIEDIEKEVNSVQSDNKAVKEDNHGNDSSDIYKRLGFNCAVNECGNKFDLDRIINDNNENTKRKTESIFDRFNIRIEWYEYLLKELQDRLINERANKDTYKRLDDIRTNIVKSLIELGKEKRKLLETRLDDFKKEVINLIDTQSKSYKDWSNLNTQIFNDGKPGFDALRIRAEQFRDHLKDRLKLVENQISFLESGGTNISVYRYLLGSGIAVAAGWFFSVFFLVSNGATKLGQEDIWFFLLKVLITSLSFNPFIAISEVLASLLIIGLVSYYSYYLLNRMKIDRNYDDITFDFAEEVNKDDNDSASFQSKNLRMKLKTDSLFGVFLHTVPVFIGLGVLFIALKIGLTNPSNNIENLNISIAGQLVGTAIAFAAGGFIYIFLAKISDLNRIRWVNYIIIALVFLIPILFWVFKDPREISIIGFIFCVILAAFPIGFGLRYKGLLQSAQRLNKLLEACSFYIRNYSTPKPVNLLSDQFRKKINDLQINALSWIDEKNQSVKDINNGDAIEEDEKRSRKNWWRRLFKQLGFRTAKNRSNKSNNSGLDDQDIHFRIQDLELDSFDKQFFPDYEKLITAYKFEYDNIRSQSQSVSLRISKHEIDIEALIIKIFNLKHNLTSVEFAARFQGISQETWLREGFELGLWYLKNKSIFPERQCPLDYFILPPSGNGHDSSSQEFTSSDMQNSTDTIKENSNGKDKKSTLDNTLNENFSKGKKKADNNPQDNDTNK